MLPLSPVMRGAEPRKERSHLSEIGILRKPRHHQARVKLREFVQLFVVLRCLLFKKKACCSPFSNGLHFVLAGVLALDLGRPRRRILRGYTC